MPYIMCPTCGAVCHVNVTNVKDWYRDYYPNATIGEMVPGLCYWCSTPLKEKMLIAIRQPTSTVSSQELQQGVIVEIQNREGEGAIYLVRLSTGEERYYIRSQLRLAPSS